MRLKDKAAIITGGSRGIGFATADKFLKEGATVILSSSSQDSADKAAAQLKEKYPEATVAGISPDLASLQSVREAFKDATAKYGCVDILVNHAGISESTPFMNDTEETFDKVMDLRTPQEYRSGHIPGSKNVPLKTIDKTASVAENKDTALYVYCQSGARSRQAAGLLRHMGYTNVHNIGGIYAYSGKVER